MERVIEVHVCLEPITMSRCPGCFMTSCIFAHYEYKVGPEREHPAVEGFPEDFLQFLRKINGRMFFLGGFISFNPTKVCTDCSHEIYLAMRNDYEGEKTTIKNFYDYFAWMGKTHEVHLYPLVLSKRAEKLK